MVRHLTAAETALWKRVAATVRPLPGSPKIAVSPLNTPPVPSPGPPKTPRLRRSTPVALPPSPPKHPLIPVASATLDGSWDQRLRRGQVSPDRVIDLHGYTLADAHAVLAAALDDAVADGARVVLVITGKGRSDRPSRIKAELADWLNAAGHRSRIAALRPAHPRHGGGGAHYLILRRTAPGHLR
ncbi:MAG: Smr/MutS family protein [Sandarakinorhabdus sp.]|nr:Smr/MutS family protein [Sandarakinorhabdus sp.]